MTENTAVRTAVPDKTDGSAAPKEKVIRRIRKKYKLFSIRSGLDMPFLLLIIALLLIGLVMMFSASYAYSYYKYGNSTKFITQQSIFAVGGVVIMLAVSVFDYHHLHKFAWLVFFVSMGLLTVVLLFRGTALVPEHNGAYRWINIGITEFQPSEVAKFALILLFAHMMSVNYERMGTFRHGVVPYVLLLIVFGGMIVAEKHISATIIVCLLTVCMMFFGGTKLRYFLVGFAIAALAAAVGYFYIVNHREELAEGNFGYALDRVEGWLHPFEPPEGVDTWQTRQSLYAIGSGQLLGLGLGQSRQKFLWLPEPQNDFIFAIICEELGFIGALIIILLFVALTWRGVLIALHAQDKFGSLLVLGIIMQVGLQTVLNLMVITNTIPNTGISLPFFSYGGTSLVMLLGEMGIVLSVSRTSHIEKT